jgi:hypothetical protein
LARSSAIREIVDASNVFWKPQERGAHPWPILNRRIMRGQPPDRAGAMRIAQAIYTDIRNSHD